MPTQVLLLSSRVYSIFYGFADTSGSGFGSTILCEGGIKYIIGTWGSNSEEDSSNFREFKNVVDTLRDEAIAGNLKDSLIIFCTDKSTVEASLVKEILQAKSSSTSPLSFACLKCEKEPRSWYPTFQVRG
jgi:hypothetical protein